MKLNLIFAKSRNNVIGKDGTMPWHLPEDLAHLKRMTLGCPVIMGRKTWDSLPTRFRPLPGRSNVVVSRQADWSAPGAQCASNLPAALALCASSELVWIIGGAQLYAQAMPLADTAVVTEIDADFDGDTYAPQFNARWHETSRETHTAVNGLRYSFVTYCNHQPEGK